MSFPLPKTIAIHFSHVYDLGNVPTQTSQDSCNFSTVGSSPAQEEQSKDAEINTRFPLTLDGFSQPMDT